MRSVKMLVVAAWLYALLWAVLPFVGMGEYGPEPFGLSCTLAWADMGRHRHGFSFVISMFTMNLAMPAVVIIGCYAGIALRLRVTFKSINSCNHLPNAIKMQRRLVLVRIYSVLYYLHSYCTFTLVSPIHFLNIWSFVMCSDTLYGQSWSPMTTRSIN